MDTNPQKSLDEQLDSVINMKKTPLWHRLVWLVVLAAVGYGGYRNRDTLMAWISRKPADAAADPAAGNAGGGRGGGRGGGGRGGGGGGTSVLAAPARKSNMSVYLRGLGSASPYNTVAVKTRVDGQLVTVTFQEGQFVKQGDLLAEVDKRPFENQLAQAKGQLAQATAQQAQARGNLARDQAQLQSAQFESNRNKSLLQLGLIPKQQVDTQNSTVGQFQGSIQADQASIAVSQAAMDVAETAIANANLQLSYARITAPVSGRIGLRLVDQGNIVHAGDANGIAVIAQVQPIAVLFNIPEDDLGPVLLKLRAGAKLKVDAYDRDDQVKIATGTLLTVDNQIDQSTGTSRLKAVFDNVDNALFPNQFVNVHLLLDVIKDATVISTASVQRGPQGTYVYVIDAEKKAHIRVVTLKNTEGNDVSVGPELQPGELVVIEGTDKVQDGAKVDVQTPAGAGGDGGGKRGGRGKTDASGAPAGTPETPGAPGATKADGSSGRGGGRGGRGGDGRGKRNGQ